MLKNILASIFFCAGSSTLQPALASPDGVDATIELFFDTCLSAEADYDMFLDQLTHRERNPFEPVEASGLEPWMQAPWSGHLIVEETDAGRVMLSFLGNREDEVVACVLHGVWQNDRSFIHYLETLEIDGERLVAPYGASLSGHPIYEAESWAIRSWRSPNLHAVFPTALSPTVTEHPFKLFTRLDPPKKATSSGEASSRDPLSALGPHSPNARN